VMCGPTAGQVGQRCDGSSRTTTWAPTFIASCDARQPRRYVSWLSAGRGVRRRWVVRSQNDSPRRRAVAGNEWIP
jgi:hypothetical protein